MEVDEKVLMHIIDARFADNISKWYQNWMLPLHEENKRKMDNMDGKLTSLVNTMEQAKGGVVMAKAGWTLAEKILAAAAFVGSFVLGHFWK